MMRNISHGNGSAPRNKDIPIKRVFALPNKHPYKISHVKKLFKKYAHGQVLDLFPYPYQADALETLTNTKNGSVDCITYDPPYSDNQLTTKYHDKGNSATPKNRKYYGKLFDLMKIKVKPGGFVISLGWNSKRIAGFEFEEIILVNHGTLHNDTIITVQKKVNESLLTFRGKGNETR